MELRRRPSGSVTPRKVATADYPSTTRRPARRVSLNGSNNSAASTASSSSRRNSINERASTSPRDHYDFGERAIKRRRISVSGKSNASQASSDYQPPGPVLRRGAGYRQSAVAREAPPPPRRKAKKARRASSASVITFDGNSSDNVMLDNIVVALSPTPVSSPELQAIGRSPRLLSPSPQPSVGVPATRGSRYSNASRGPSPRPTSARKTPSDNSFSDLPISNKPGDFDHAAEPEELTLADPGPGLSAHLVEDGKTSENLELVETSHAARGAGDERAKVESLQKGTSTTTSEEPANSSDWHSVKHVSKETSIATNAAHASEMKARQQLENDTHATARTAETTNKDLSPSESESDEGRRAEHETLEESQVAEEADDDDEDDGDDGGSGSFAASQPDDDALAEARQIGQDDEDDDDGEELDDDEEMVDVEDDRASDQSKQPDDTGSAAVSDLDDDPAAVDLAVPKLVMTTASPLHTGSEENNAAPSPTSMAADELIAAGPGKPVRRLPGRRRAPHPNPKIEADLRRQLDLRVTYRAVAKQLKPLLAELAKRNIADLKSDPEAHVKVSEHKTVTASLDQRLEDRLNNIRLEKQYNQEKMALLLEAEQDSQRMRYRQSIRNAQADFMNKLKHDFLMAVRRQEQEQDEYASENEENDVVPSLYHVNVHGRRNRLLDRKFDSRSRSIIETERLFNELSQREYSMAREMQTVPEQDELDPKPFTFMDPTQREAVEHDVKLASLIEAMTRVGREKLKSPTKPEFSIRIPMPIPNDQAISLQVLATASATAPGPTPTSLPSLASITASSPGRKNNVEASKTIAKSTMASLLNADESPIRPDRNSVIRGATTDYYGSQQQAQPPPGYYMGSPANVAQASPYLQQQQRVLPGFADQFEDALKSPEQRRYELQHSSVPPPQYQPTSSRDMYSSTNGLDRHNEAMAPMVNGTMPSPYMQQSSITQHPSPYGLGSPGQRNRRESHGSFGQVRIAPKGAASPDKQSTAPAQPWGQLDYASDRDHAPGQFRQPEQRGPASFNPYPQSSSPAGYRDSAGRDRGISETGRLPPIGDPPYASFGRDRPYDPFRRSTISSADDSSRHYSPPQTNLPPHLQRSTTAGSSPLLSSHTSVPSPPERFGRFPHEPSSHRNRQPLQLPPALPPFTAPPRPIGIQQTPLPPMPTGLPPPPLPPLQPHPPQTGYGQSMPASFQGGPPPMQAGHYGSGAYGRQSLPPLPGPPHYPGQAGQPGSGYPPYPAAQPGQDERGGRSRTSSMSRQDRFQYYSGPR